MGVLADLPHQGVAIASGHPIFGLNFFISKNSSLKLFFQIFYFLFTHDLCMNLSYWYVPLKILFLYIKIHYNFFRYRHRLTTKCKIISYFFRFQGIIYFHFYFALHNLTFAGTANSSLTGKR